MSIQPTMFTDTQINPSHSAALATLNGTDLNNLAFQAKLRGDFQEAERLYLLAIEVKERYLEPNSTITAISQNMLGEVYIKMGEIEEAERQLKRAMAARNEAGPAFDDAVTRENLAQLSKMKGKMSEAKELRLRGAPNSIVCANTECTLQALSMNVLKQCSSCKSVYYCSEACQRIDWRVRHKRYCPTPAL